MDLTGKKVAVYGLGVSGLGALEYLKDKDLAAVTIVNRGSPDTWKDKLENFSKEASFPQTLFDEKNDQVKEQLAACDFILLSPGIPREHENLEQALKKEVPVWNELELGYQILVARFSKAPPVMALTGTNGKTTCVTFLGEVLKESGLRPFIGGNIGRSLLEGLAQQERGLESFDCYLFEVSSFQCESLESFRPQVAGILNLFANHGERYVDLESYRQAKWLLGKNQKEQDVMLTGPGTELPRYQYQGNHLAITESVADALEKEFSLAQFKLIGTHNRWNLAFCWNFLMMSAPFLSKDLGSLRESFQKALNSFSGVEHRIEYVGRWQEKVVYNDAKSTNWQATITALKAVKERGLKSLVILGGQLRGHGDDIPMEFLNELNSNIQVVMFGESAQYLKERGVSFPCFQDLQEVKKYAQTLQEVELILLSPAFPSFDQFSNYKERGEFFKTLFC